MAVRNVTIEKINYEPWKILLGRESNMSAVQQFSRQNWIFLDIIGITLKFTVQAVKAEHEVATQDTVRCISNNFY